MAGCELRFLILDAACRLTRLSICSSRFPQPQVERAWDFQLFIKSSVTMVVQLTSAVFKARGQRSRLSCPSLPPLEKAIHTGHSLINLRPGDWLSNHLPHPGVYG